MKRLRIRFWVLLAVVSILTLSVAVASVTLTWRNNTWRLVTRLNSDSRTQAARFLNERLSNILEVAPQQSKTNRELLKDRLLSFSDLKPLAEYWSDILRIHDDLSYLSLSFEDDGEMLWVSRDGEGEIVIGHLEPGPEPGEFRLSEYLPGSFPDRPVRVDSDRKEGDPRQRAWYRKAKASGVPVWSEVYVFLGTDTVPNMPGVTYATPLYEKSGELVGVLTADIELHSLCEYLRATIQEARDSRRGRTMRSVFAFVAERDSEGNDRVIAYHDLSKILKKTSDSPETWELVPSDEIDDPPLRGFLDEVLKKRTTSTALDPTPVHYTYRGIRYVGIVHSLQGQDMPRWLIGAAIEQRESMAPIYSSIRETFLWASVWFGVAVWLSVLLARKLSKPLQSLAVEVQTIGRGNLESGLVGTVGIEEIDALIQAKEEMKSGLRSFQKYVPKELVLDLLASGEEAELGGKRSRLTVAFADIVNFTSMAERMEPEDVVEMLSGFHGILYEEIVRTHGTLDKYIGDAVMAFWGAPIEKPDHAYSACLAALESQKRLASQRALRERTGEPPVHCRIGINTGELVVGNMGISNRLSYTVIGDSVNLASRLEGLNRYYGTDILISEFTFQEVSDRVIARKLDRVFVKGKTRGVLVYELIGIQGEVPDSLIHDIREYEKALDLYFRQHWTEAMRLLEDMKDRYVQDRAVAHLLDRCRHFKTHPPGEDWDGTWRMG